MLLPGVRDLNWYVEFRDVIYLFHMCFFIFLSGFLIGYTSLPKYTKPQYFKLIKKKIIKFVPPYLLFSFLFLVLENTFGVGKWSNYLSDIFKMGFYPSQSPAGFLWYLYVILFFYIITPIINYVSKKKYEWVILVSLMVYFIDLPRIFALEQIGEYFLFFAIGLYFSQNYTKIFSLISKMGYLFIPLFALFIFFRHHIVYPKLILGLTSIPTLMFLALKLKNNSLFQYLGKYSFQIYLMNSIIIGTIATILFKFFNFTPNIFGLILLLTLGLLLPIVLYKFIIKKNDFLNKIIN